MNSDLVYVRDKKTGAVLNASVDQFTQMKKRREIEKRLGDLEKSVEMICTQLADLTKRLNPSV